MTETTHDLGALFDEHLRHEFVAQDVANTMATMVSEPYVNHVPTMMGGVGGDALAEFYGSYFIGHWPADTTITPVCRTVGVDRLVDEMIMSFTHDIVMPSFLPGVPPTGRSVRLPVVAVVGFEAGKIAYERIYWDQASLLAQVGLLNEAALPITGVVQAHKVLDESLPANTLLHHRSRLPHQPLAEG
ncbi:MAG TPA: nuclear transport factor 2 family protein [Mycobacterium sp.]|nr:nuclear transport factor 2 family protein [Mycobacterium sp.]